MISADSVNQLKYSCSEDVSEPSDSIVNAI